MFLRASKYIDKLGKIKWLSENCFFFFLVADWTASEGHHPGKDNQGVSSSLPFQRSPWFLHL